jgi:hypothetical protein
MCEKGSTSNVLKGKRTLRADTAHCRINKKTKQKQPTDRAAPCGLLSGPLSVGSCTPPLMALPASWTYAAPRLLAKSHSRYAMQPMETPETTALPGKARADRGDAAE